MNIIQCKVCKKPFHSLGNKTCNACLEQIDKDFITVRDYIYDNPNSRIEKICEETGVERATILQLLREGRLILDNPDAEGLLVCDICKKAISTGRMCDECKDQVSKTMSGSFSKDKPSELEKKNISASKHTAKMHTNIRRKQ